MRVTFLPWALLANPTPVGSLHTLLPAFRENWAWNGSEVAVINGKFKRSVFEAPHEGYASNPSVQQAYDTPIDPRSALLQPSTGELFFVEWGFSAGPPSSATHDW
jgi:hypothetical protein